MPNNCCAITVIRSLARVYFVFMTMHGSTSVVRSKVYENNPHLLELKIFCMKFELFRRTNCGELLDISSGEVQIPGYHKDVSSNMNCEFGNVCKMVDNDGSFRQHTVIKFLVKEEKSAAEIHLRL
ncbi:hypothetical protein ANN_18728 [Periplaneta americana]|uniref:Uncharacterized protein n=1 Tax=Periplaneta americana TaxID=6978 RepID=A0ABQ8SQT8_PERAM|nr:hypothetical protein ANN_18728 [Periplaneta americana]